MRMLPRWCRWKSTAFMATLAATQALIAASPSLTFVYVSGEGADRTGNSRQMWARVKGRTENELLAMPMTAYMFRPCSSEPSPAMSPPVTPSDAPCSPSPA
ncbi:hypothetical protein [Streptomyces sp. NPDC005827]|uniref:hypothetical protein n=1 Tax=Streptomyces sp. NPDC005827 TaxID=3157070 RepID=UPI0034083753